MRLFPEAGPGSGDSIVRYCESFKRTALAYEKARKARDDANEFLKDLEVLYSRLEPSVREQLSYFSPEKAC